MKSWQLLGETRAPDGTHLSLMRRDDEHVILAGGKTLMSSRMHGSEEALAVHCCRSLQSTERPVVLVGGLGMGFTLRATLDLLPPNATVVVSELVADVVNWNRGPLGPLAGHPLKDRRVVIEVGDVASTIRTNQARFDGVLLDVDNGPDPFTTARNNALYDNAGVAAAYAALKVNGIFAVWSAWEDRKFEQRLRYHGFIVDVQRERARLKKGGPRHTIFLGRRPR